MEVILIATLVFSWMVYLWDEYLAQRQIKLISSSEVVPVEVESVYDQKTFDKAKPYQLEKNHFNCWHDFYSQVLLTVILLLYVLPFSWRQAEQLALNFGLGQEYEITISMIWLLIVSIFNIVTELPWIVYSVFVIEARHGFNKQVGVQLILLLYAELAFRISFQ
jgi:STE24 endopeptidase